MANGLGLGKGVSSTGGGAPRICAVVDLAGGSPWDAVKAIESEGEDGGIVPVPGHSAEEALAKGDAFCEVEASRFRQTIQFLPLPYGALYPTMDACKCADFVLLVLSSTRSIEPGSWGELCLRALQAQGLPTVLVSAPTLHPEGQAGLGGSKKAGPLQRAVNETRKSLLSFAQYFAPEVEKVHALDEHAERSTLIRTLATATPKRVSWRDFRSWLVSEGAEWIPNVGDSTTGKLQVNGWIRGTPISANRLVHIPDHGDFEVDKIIYAPLPTVTRHAKRPVSLPPPLSDTEEVEMDDAEDDPAEPALVPLQPGETLDERDEEEADDLRSVNSVDDMANEQTWPTEEEIAAGEARQREAQGGVQDEPPPAAPGTTPKTITRNPRPKKDDLGEKYRAAWIIESDDEGSEDDDEEEEEMGDVEVDSAAPAISDASEGDDEEMDFDEAEEQAAYEDYQARKQAERDENDENKFPDEVDTPMNVSARQRFARYRGLKSFRTSPWDAYEDLPQDYAKIFQFDSFNRTKRRIQASALLDGVPPGTRVGLVLRNVPIAAAIQARASGVAHLPPLNDGERVPFVVFGLLQHEHKMSVQNIAVTRNTEFTEPVRSKDELVMCLGPRRYITRPQYSMNTLSQGKMSNGVHKWQRFLPHGIAASIATVYAPITFGAAQPPVVFFKQRNAAAGEAGHDQRGVGAAQTPHLVATGSLLGAQPTRINAKRIFLTGHPFKVHKKTATIRWMFFNPEDVRYFQPITLHTKYGRSGNITEPLGTHGYFKAHFDGPITQMDTVMLPLYKRVYPRWPVQFTASRAEMPLPRSEVTYEEDAE